MSKPIGYVYLTTNTINGKKYVGIKKSDVFIRNYYGSGTLITKALKKYGKNNFKIEVLHWCYTIDELVIQEIYEIKKRNAANSQEYYNIIDTPVPMLCGENNGFYGRTHTDETKKLLSSYRKGIPISEERKKAMIEFKNSESGKEINRLMSERRKGVPISEEHKQKIVNTTRKEDYRKNISDIKKEWYDSTDGKKLKQKLTELAKERFTGVEKTQEHKNKIAESHTGTQKPWVSEKINKNPEKIRKTAEKHRGMKRSEEARKNISEACKGKIPHNKGCFYCYNVVNGEKLKLKNGEDIPHGYAKGYKKPKV